LEERRRGGIWGEARLGRRADGRGSESVAVVGKVGWEREQVR
jgi:hypothetical protein